LQKSGARSTHAVLDIVHAVVVAVTWVFIQVKTGIKKLIQFVEMLFNREDIRGSKDIMHYAFMLWMQYQANNIPNARDTVVKSFGEFKRAMKEWAGTCDWSYLSDASKKPAADSTSNPNKNQISSSKLLANHYQNHASQLTVKGESPFVSAVQQLVNDLLAAISKEVVVLEGAYKEPMKLAKDFEEILRRLVATLGDAVLSSVQVVVDTLLALLHDVAQYAATLLDTKIPHPHHI
jgi:hypothetical protein